ncbi:WD40 repeat domain-containing protein [Aureimonas sp. AU4]|uniref:WD40 repeat domain-containing protein n=1 Tax=Aureimonas sp. AU4 TaxID=1638163 RepID=UPI0007802EA4|nr:WD40 repeat domain-containing protein [Aureimonas sp. AU4]
MPQIAPYSFGGPVEAAVFLGDEPVFALSDGTIRLPAGGERTLEAHGGGLLVARLDASGRRLLSGGEDGRVIATAVDGTMSEVGSAGRRWVTAVAGGPNGAVAWASGRTAFVREAKGETRELAHARTVEDVAFAPKGLRLATARYDGASLFFPATDAKAQELEWKGAHTGVLFSPDNRFLVTIMQENALHGWRLEDGKHMRMTGYPAKIRSWSWSFKAKYLATSGAPAAILWPFSGRDGPMGKAPLELGTRGDTMVTAVCCHPADEILAIGYADGMVLAVRIADGREALLRRGGSGAIRTMGWDGAGRFLAFGSESGEAGVVDISA